MGMKDIPPGMRGQPGGNGGPPGGALQVAQPVNDIQLLAHLAASLPPIQIQLPPAEGETEGKVVPADLAVRTQIAADYIAQAVFHVESGHLGEALVHARSAAQQVVVARVKREAEAKAEADRKQKEVDDAEAANREAWRAEREQIAREARGEADQAGEL